MVERVIALLPANCERFSRYLRIGNRGTLATLLLLTVMVLPALAAGQEAAEEKQAQDVLAVVHFDPATYKLYRPWADRWFEELGKPLAPHKRPEVDGDRLINPLPGNELPVDWVRTILSLEAVRSNDEDVFVMTVPMPVEKNVNRSFYSSIAEKLIMQVFYNQHGFAQEAFQVKQEEVERKAREYEESAQKVQDVKDSFRQRLEHDRREISDETLQAQIAAIEEGPKLELEMNLAEMAARRETILRKLADVQEDVSLESELGRKRQEVTEGLTRAVAELEELKKHLERYQDPAGSDKLDAAAKRVEELKQGAATIEHESARVASSGALHGQLKQLLTDAEINVAGLEARRDVLLRQYEALKERLEIRVRIQQEIDELNVRKSELQTKAQEVYESLNADEFRTPRPVIEWVPEPEQATQ